MMWNLPISVEIDGKEYAITNKCDYRMVLDVICALNDNELDEDQKIRTALYIFYEDIFDCENLEKAVKEMFKIISYGEEDDGQNQDKPRLMDWEHDFPQIAPPISRILGFDVRTPDKYVHYWTFIGAYMEIGECTFNNIISIRNKRAKGKPLEKWEEEFFRENYRMVNLPNNLTTEEAGWLFSDE